MFLARTIFYFIFVFLFSTNSFADDALLKRESVQAFINMMVKEHNFKRQYLVQTIKDVKIQPAIIESITRPYEKKSWDTYKSLFVTPLRVQSGIEFWKENEKILVRAQKEYGVPADIIVAIIGVETLYGKHMGNYKVLDALATLAFDYPKRAPFFTKELKEYLLLCKENHVSPNKYMGSYAGAMGKPQFMPSSYRFYAVDFTGNGERDLISNNHDVIGSVANYFHQHGWQLNKKIAQPAKISGTKYQKIKTNTKNADYSFSKLLASGIKPVSGLTNHPAKAGLIELDTKNGAEYWLAYHNFYVITRYNTSPQYALAVYLLSQQLREQWAHEQMKSPHAYT